jgi:hypothetical protein
MERRKKEMREGRKSEGREDKKEGGAKIGDGRRGGKKQ